MRTKLLLFILVLFLGGSLWSSQPQDTCKLWLTQFFVSEEEKLQGLTTQSLEVSFRSETESWNGETSETKVRVLSYDGLSYLISKELEVYQDSETTVSVVHNDKSIYVSNPSLVLEGRRSRVTNLFQQNILKN